LILPVAYQPIFECTQRCCGRVLRKRFGSSIFRERFSFSIFLDACVHARRRALHACTLKVRKNA
jgi:hypothetical protein